jgi:hypothetical protein
MAVPITIVPPIHGGDTPHVIAAAAQAASEK